MFFKLKLQVNISIHWLCSSCVHILPGSMCVQSCVFVHTIMCFLGPQNFVPFFFFPICKGGNVVVEA
jgi:hypothetical protein